MWQPDGWGWRARIGVLTPHGDIGPEAEFRAMAPEGVSIHAARVPCRDDQSAQIGSFVTRSNKRLVSTSGTVSRRRVAWP
jgi:maleate cis-trans isomerase